VASGSTPLTPEIVLISTGHTEANTTMTTSVRRLSWTMSRTSGTRTTGGIGRMNSITGRTADSTAGSEPSSRPAGTAMITVITIDSAQAAIVDPTLARNEPFLARSATLPSTVDGGGKSCGLTRPAHRASWTAPVSRTSPAAPR
jgi:hypothetical protein